MKHTFSKSDKYGSYHIEYKDKVIMVVAKGAFGQSLSKSFSRHVSTVAKAITESRWGYYAELNEFEAYTQDALDVLLCVHTLCLELGCVADAYSINSILAKEQLKQMRCDAKITSALDLHIFDSESKALEFIHSVINRYK